MLKLAIYVNICAMPVPEIGHPLNQEISLARYAAGYLEGRFPLEALLDLGEAPGPLRSVVYDPSRRIRIIESVNNFINNSRVKYMYIDEARFVCRSLEAWVAPRKGMEQLTFPEILIDEEGVVHAQRYQEKSSGNFARMGYFVNPVFLGKSEEAAMARLSDENLEDHVELLRSKSIVTATFRPREPEEYTVPPAHLFRRAA